MKIELAASLFSHRCTCWHSCAAGSAKHWSTFVSLESRLTISISQLCGNMSELQQVELCCTFPYVQGLCLCHHRSMYVSHLVWRMYIFPAPSNGIKERPTNRQCMAPQSYSVAQLAIVYFEIVVCSALFAPPLFSSTLVMLVLSCNWLQFHLFPHVYTKYHTCAQQQFSYSCIGVTHPTLFISKSNQCR